MSVQNIPGAEPLYTAAQTRELDRCTIEEHGVPGIVLMSRAASAAFDCLLGVWPNPEFIHVLCGTGNNGGDGFLIADLAHKRGIAVQLYQLGDAAKIGGDALTARKQALANGVPIQPFTPEGFDLVDDGIIVDAMLGTGLGGDVREPYLAAIESINDSGLPVLAVDIPSGLCSDTGRVLGAAVCADVTVSFIGLKRGLFTLEAPDHTGAIHFTDLQVPTEIYSQLASRCARLELEPLLACLPPRPASSHKGSYGSVLIVGGDKGMAGAVAMAAEAALRCGAGLVRVATHAEHVPALVARTPEVMAHAVGTVQDLTPLIEQSDVLVVGPGLGQTPWSQQMLHAALASGKPMVLDADGLNLLVRDGGVAEQRDNWVLTPHPGEAARLLSVTTADIQADRFASVQQLQQQYGGIIILKGNGSLIASDEQMLLSDYGNPGMASGGMGDVLSGVLGALLAQAEAHGMSALESAALAVVLHGAAADMAAQDGQRGLCATDLIPGMRELLG
jgi:NAD(P)H-hydrate epimerase